MRLAARMDRLGTETAFTVLARARALEAEGREIIHLEIGEPDFDTPRNVDRGRGRGPASRLHALHAGAGHPAAAAGDRRLRGAHARHHRDAREVVVGAGRQADHVLLDVGAGRAGRRGDLMPNPAFPIYESMVEFLGGQAGAVRLHESRGLRVRHGRVCGEPVAQRTRMVILNSPAEPDRRRAEPRAIKTIAELLADDPDVVVLSDEIYFAHPLRRRAPLASPPMPGMQERTIILDGFSKTYAMTGWRLGYGVMPVCLAEAVTQLQINATRCVNAAHPTGRHRSAHRPAGRRGQDGRRVPRAAGAHR